MSKSKSDKQKTPTKHPPKHPPKPPKNPVERPPLSTIRISNWRRGRK